MVKLVILNSKVSFCLLFILMITKLTCRETWRLETPKPGDSGLFNTFLQKNMFEHLPLRWRLSAQKNTYFTTQTGHWNQNMWRWDLTDGRMNSQMAIVVILNPCCVPMILRHPQIEPEMDPFSQGHTSPDLIRSCGAGWTPGGELQFQCGACGAFFWSYLQ